MNVDGSQRRVRGTGPMPRWSRVALLPIALVTLGLVNVPAANAATPSLKVFDKTVTERNTAGLVAKVKVQLSQVPTRRVTVDFRTVNGTASAPGDYTAKSGTLAFPAGTRTKTISVPIKGDLLAEARETFKVRISNPFRARIADAVGVVTILDNDTMPGVSVGSASVPEGNSGAAPLNIPVSLTSVSGAPISVPYTITPGTATFNTDYTATPVTGTLAFPAGTQTQNLSISVLGDLADETDETVNVTLVNPVNAVLVDGTGLATIRDDDGPNITINDVARNEGSTANNPFTFTVSLSAASPQTVTVNYATVNGSAGAGSDYTAASGTLTFLPSQTARSVTVFGQGDLNVEGNETFGVNLGSPVNGAITDSQGLGTIVNDDFSSTDEGIGAAAYLGNVSGDVGAGTVGSGTQSILLGDADWYRVGLSENAFSWLSPDNLWARVGLTVADLPPQTSGDIDMQIYRANGTLVGSSSLGGTADETFNITKADNASGFFTDPDDSTFFYVKVYGFGSVMNNYSLTVVGNSHYASGPGGTLRMAPR